MRFSRRMTDMPENTLVMLEARRREILAAGGEVINLSAGTPDLPPDRHVMETLSHEALNPVNYQYAISDFVELLDAAVRWYKRRFDVELTREQVCSLYGSQEGIAHVCFPLCDPGDIVLVQDPSYPIFAFGPPLSGAELVYIPLKAEHNFIIDLDGIDPALADRAKVMIVSYPNNPTTAVADDDFYIRLVAFAKKHDIIILHDNAYSELNLDGQPGRSFLQTPGAVDVGIEFNSLSKSYNLTGMRMSFALGNAGIIGQLRKFRSQIDYGPFPAIQRTAIAVLDGPQDILGRNRAEYRKRRDALGEGLRSIGWDVPIGGSTMFTWYPLPDGRTDDFEFVLEMLDKTGVIAVPGSSFGPAGKGFVRFALVQPVDVLQRVVQRIRDGGLLR